MTHSEVDNGPCSHGLWEPVHEHALTPECALSDAWGCCARCWFKVLESTGLGLQTTPKYGLKRGDFDPKMGHFGPPFWSHLDPPEDPKDGGTPDSATRRVRGAYSHPPRAIPSREGSFPDPGTGSH